MEHGTGQQPTGDHETHERRVGKRRKVAIGVAVSLVATLLIGAVVAGNYYSGCASGEPNGRPVEFAVPVGASASDVVEKLAERDVIPCGGIVGQMLLQRTGKASQIRAGTFGLREGMTLDQALAVLTAPPKAVPTVTITYPEGYRLIQIAARTQESLGIPAGTFMALAKSGQYSLAPYLPSGTGSIEGFLFPNTYQFRRAGTNADDVIRRMLEEFDRQAGGLPFQNASGLGVTPYEAVVIASMIEKEARVEKDRPLIASVIYNRIKLGMTLGIDATLLYEFPPDHGPLTSADLAMDSPYNTRINAGLPPTPIASPGRASLDAALRPARTDYLYYVLCGSDGSHRFSKDYSTFLNDKRECLG